MIKSITDAKIITSKQERNNDNKINIYKFNKEVLKEHINLNMIANPECFGYDAKYNKLLGIEAHTRQTNNEYVGNLDANIFN